MTDLETLRKQFYSNDDEDDILFDAPARVAETIPHRKAIGPNLDNSNARPGPSVIDRSLNTRNVSDVPRRAPDRMDLDTATLEFPSPDISEETDMQQLLRHWQNERHAPEILQSQDALLGRILDQIRRQVGS